MVVSRMLVVFIAVAVIVIAWAFVVDIVASRRYRGSRCWLVNPAASLIGCIIRKTRQEPYGWCEGFTARH
jgi:hypothetical protein